MNGMNFIVLHKILVLKTLFSSFDISKTREKKNLKERTNTSEVRKNNRHEVLCLKEAMRDIKAVMAAP